VVNRGREEPVEGGLLVCTAFTREREGGGSGRVRRGELQGGGLKRRKKKKEGPEVDAPARFGRFTKKKGDRRAQLAAGLCRWKGREGASGGEKKKRETPVNASKLQAQETRS